MVPRLVGLLLALPFLWGRAASAQRHPPVIAYDCEPRLPNGHVNVDAIVNGVAAAHVDGYDYLIWRAPTDYADLGRLLAAADSAKFQVWVTLTPPTEQVAPYGLTQPYGLDFVAWQRAISTLAGQHPSLRGLIIDDFELNTGFFSPELFRSMRAVRDSLGGRPELWVVIYHRLLDALPRWWPRRARDFDGVMFAYEGYANADSLGTVLAQARRTVPGGPKIGVNIFVRGGPKAPMPRRTVDYVSRTLAISDSVADVTRLYCFPIADGNDSLTAATRLFTSGVRHQAGPR